MTELAAQYEEAIVEALAARADPMRAEAMAAYLRDQFDFFGVPTPQRRGAMRAAIAGRAPLSRFDLLDLASRCWVHDEREVLTCAIELLRMHVGLLDSDDLGAVRTLIQTRSWWDSIDPIASQVVGPMVFADRSLATVMDAWVDDDDFWIARTAILHQLTWKVDTDADRLFAYCEQRAADTEFFLRKAIGWALREYAKTDADAVRTFVADHDDVLSGLSKREALKNIG